MDPIDWGLQLGVLMLVVHALGQVYHYWVLGLLGFKVREKKNRKQRPQNPEDPRALKIIREDFRGHLFRIHVGFPKTGMLRSCVLNSK